MITDLNKTVQRRARTTNRKNIKVDQYWRTQCGSWVSEDFFLRIEAANVKRILDNGNCECQDHPVYKVTKTQDA